MSVRSLNWLKFGGLVGLAFVLGLLFAGLLDLPQSSLAQGGVTHFVSSRPAVKPVAAPNLAASRSLVELSEAFSAVAEHIRPSVVYVKSERKERITQVIPRVPRGFEPFFQFPNQPRGPVIERGSGSGFVVSNDGYILTNNHVVDGAQKVTVQLLDRRSFPATVVGTDPATDVAVIKIDARGLTPAPLGSSAQTKIGEWVLAVGNPLGDNLTFTVTSGIVSAKGRGLPSLPGRSDRSIQDFIQTDAAINPGNSGGPLVNVRGEVIGINAAIASETGYNQGYGFAVPIDLARQVMEQLISHGKVERAALGVLVQDADATDAKYVGLPDIRGVKVQEFSSESSPAKSAGVELGDIIVSVDGQPVEYTAQLQQVVGFRHPGEVVKVEVARKGGVRKTFSVRLTSANSSAAASPASRKEEPDNADNGGGEEAAGAAVRPLGITVVPVTTQIAGELELPAGMHGLVVQKVDDDGPVAELLNGAENDSPDIILSAEDQPVRTVEDLRNALKHPGPGGIVTLIVYNPRFGTQGARRVVRVQLK